MKAPRNSRYPYRALGPGEGGFTLLEIIISLTITAVIFVILLSAFRMGQGAVEKGAQRDEINQRMRILNDRLTWLIRGAYPYTIKQEGKERLVFQGGSNELGFVTTSTDKYSEGLEDAAGLKWISIYTDEEGLKTSERIFFMDAPPEEEKNGFLLDRSVSRISFEYYDPGEKEEEPGWWPQWDLEKKDYLPTAVKATLVLTIDEKEHSFPPVVATIKAGHSPIMVTTKEKEKETR